MLNRDATTIKLKVVTSQPPTNKNGFVSADELQRGSKKTIQALIPQVMHGLVNRGLQMLLRSGHRKNDKQ
jgi:hypothetical protein